MWTRSKTVLMSLMLISVATLLTPVLLYSYQAYLTSQKNTPLFEMEEFECGILYINGMPVQGPDMGVYYPVPMRLPNTLKMGTSDSLAYYDFGIYLSTFTKMHLSFEATAPISFLMLLDPTDQSLRGWEIAGEPGQTIVNETSTTHFDSQFYLMGSNFYILDFEPIITRPTATVTLNAQLN
jgi:hypothetical protein